MSLLIKALDKAQDAKVKQAQAEVTKQEKAKLEQPKKAQEKRPKALKSELSIADVDSELSLSPPKAPLLDEVELEQNLIPASILDSAAVAAQKEISIKTIEIPTQKPVFKPITQATQQVASKVTSQANSSTPTQAANVFSAKRIEVTHQNAKLALIAGAGLIAMLAMGAYYYQFVDSTPDVPMPPIRPPQIVASPPTPAQEPMSPEVSAETVSQPASEADMSPAPDTTQAFEPRDSVKSESTKLARKNKAITQLQSNDEETIDAENTLDSNEVVVSLSKHGTKSNVVKLDKAIASDSASIQVTQSKPQDAINPTLMRAYEAYNAGNLSEAQKLYKQVLQRDNSNVDAMLGLGAIATRQDRVADANGWYRKVLGIEPRNSTAQAAMLDTQQQDDPQTSESHIKLMLAKSPNDANLHVALGNLYAEQNQWPAAQQAYFDAYRLNANTENAFNLGVSLDQMGKPKLALPYYQQALQLAEQSGANGIDKAALEARIAAIQ